MKTSEFKEAVEKIGFTVEINVDGGFNIDNENDTVACVSRNERYNLDTDWFDFEKLEENKRGELFLLLTTYANTPISKREEEKRYRLKSTNKMIAEDVSYLNKWEDDDRYYLSSLIPIVGAVRTIFTESELETMDLTGFEKAEVTE